MENPNLRIHPQRPRTKARDKNSSNICLKKPNKNHLVLNKEKITSSAQTLRFTEGISFSKKQYKRNSTSPDETLAKLDKKEVWSK